MSPAVFWTSTRSMRGAYIFSSGKNMGVFKAVGYPEDVGRFYRLDEYAGYCLDSARPLSHQHPGLVGRRASLRPAGLLAWCTTAKFPPTTRTAAAIEMYGYECNLLTDTEVIAYIARLSGAPSGPDAGGGCAR